MDFSVFDDFEEEVVVIDKNYRIVYANKKYAEDMGYSSPEEVIGDFCYVVSHHQEEPCDGECHPCPLKEIEKHGRSVNVVHTHYTHDNRELPVEISAFPIDGGSKILQIIREIRSDKERYYLFSLSQKLSSVGFLALGIAHQLSTPLGTILLALEDLEEKFGPCEEIDLIKSSVENCKTLVDRLLHLVRRGGSKDLVNIRRAVSEAVDLLKVYAKERGVSIEEDLEEVGYSLCCEADIRHLVLNIVLNAIQASESGSKVWVRLRRGEGSWVLEVEDRGCGIDPEDLGRIFIPFYQGKGKREGAGLGLAIVSSIVKEYKGSIDVRSRPGEGTLFRVSVPLS